MIKLLKISKFLLYLVPLTAIIVYQGTLFPFIVGKYVFFRTIIGLALIFFIWAWAKGEIKISDFRPQISNPLIIAVSAFVLIFLLAGFIGYNPSASFWSNFERGEGGLQMIYLFIFFVLLVILFKDDKSWHRLFVVSIWAAILVIAYGVAGALGIGNFVGQSLCLRFSGSLGNPAYTGTYLIFALFYAAYLANGEKHKVKKWFWLSVLVLFFVFLLLTQTRGALLGLGAAILIGLLYLFFILPAGWLRKLIPTLIILLIASGTIGFIFRRSINITPFCPTELGGGNRILDINFETETFQTRLLLWQQSIKAFGERPILGWGPENFMVAFEKYYNIRFETWYDRAHNIFFDYLVTTGILGLSAYLSIFAIFYWQFFRRIRTSTDKNTDKYGKNQHQSTLGPFRSALLFALPIAYLVQGLVLFEVLSIYINLFLFLAFINYQFNVKDEKH